MKSKVRFFIISLVLGSVLTWSYYDYQSWVSLGKGGLPHHVGGWLTTTFYCFVGGDSMDMSGFENDIGKSWDLVVLEALEARSGTKPEIAPQPVPHRQITQVSNIVIKQLIRDRVEQISKNNSGLLSYKKSHTEKHNKALWARDFGNINNHSGNEGEIAHVHTSEGSLHVILSPSDAKTVMKSHWGELHPLSSAGFMESNTYILIYAPRTIKEVNVIEQIVKASVMYTTNVMPK